VNKNARRLSGVVLMGMISFLALAAPAQEKLTAAPDPSYAEGGPPAYRHPGLESTRVSPGEGNAFRLVLRSSLLRRESVPAQSSTGFLAQILCVRQK